MRRTRAETGSKSFEIQEGKTAAVVDRSPVPRYDASLVHRVSFPR